MEVRVVEVRGAQRHDAVADARGVAADAAVAVGGDGRVAAGDGVGRHGDEDARRPRRVEDGSDDAARRALDARRRRPVRRPQGHDAGDARRDGRVEAGRAREPAAGAVAHEDDVAVDAGERRPDRVRVPGKGR